MPSFDFSITQLLMAAVTVFIIYWLWTKTRRSYTNLNIPPFPVSPWPYFGHFFLLQGNFRNRLKDWRKHTGDIYSLDIAGELHILVNDFKDMKEIWVKRADYIVNIQHSLGDELLDEYNTGITAARDDNWKEQRDISLSILRKFGMGKNLLGEQVQDEVRVLLGEISISKGQPMDVRLLLASAISNIVSSVVVGKRFDYDDPYLQSLVTPIMIFIKYFAQMMLLTPFRVVLSLPGDIFHAKKWVQATAMLEDVYSKPFLQQFKKEFNEHDEPHNFISAYLKEMKHKEKKGIHTHLNDKNLIAIIRTLFAAGTDTTTTTILWCFLYMMHYPKIQEKVYQEIETIVGTERMPTLNDKPMLTYLNAVIMETQRISSLVPIGFKREVSETFKYKGFTFPKGCVVWPVLDSVLHDKKIWGDPENFRPERFIDLNGALINREEFIPFSIGRRICLGESLAKMNLFLFLASMFQRFKFEPASKSGDLPSLDGVFGMTVVPQEFKLRFIDRKG